MLPPLLSFFFALVSLPCYVILFQKILVLLSPLLAFNFQPTLTYDKLEVPNSPSTSLEIAEVRIVVNIAGSIAYAREKYKIYDFHKLYAMKKSSYLNSNEQKRI